MIAVKFDARALAVVCTASDPYGSGSESGQNRNCTAAGLLQYYKKSERWREAMVLSPFAEWNPLP